MEPLGITESKEELKKMKPLSSPFSPFKSKKILRSTSKSTSSDETQSSDPKTPMKPMQLRTRSRSGGVAFSLKQVKNAAQTLNKSNTKKKPSDDLDLLESTTPVKSPKKKTKPSIKLPERYEMLAKFFDDMQSTMRLLKLKGTMRSFTNISPGVECLSDRRFSYTHLAQMKYVLPEAIELKKITVVDQKTCCTKSDLEIELLPDAIESDGKGNTRSGYCNLSKEFRSRLLEFFKTHPQEDEIPIGELPEPFNKRMQNVLSLEQNCTSPLPVLLSSDVRPFQSSVAASHLPRSFKTRFAQKTPIIEAEKTQLLSTTLSITPSPLNTFPRVKSLNNASPLAIAPVSDTPKAVEIGNKETVAVNNNDCSQKEVLHSNATPAKLASTPSFASDTLEKPLKDFSSKETLHPEGTPAKPISTPMTVTPVLQTPKRSRTIQDVASTPSPNKLTRRPPKRPLFTTPVKKTKSLEINELEKSSDDYLTNLLPEALRKSLMEKESETAKAQDIAISQAKRRKQMIACLPNLFNMIHLMFQSVNSCVITKEELIYKIIRSHQDITDRAELEEQLKLLKELVPDWIQEKVASSGDLLFRINKRSCPDSVRRRLSEAL